MSHTAGLEFFAGKLYHSIWISALFFSSSLFPPPLAYTFPQALCLCIWDVSIYHPQLLRFFVVCFSCVWVCSGPREDYGSRKHPEISFLCEIWWMWTGSGAHILKHGTIVKLDRICPCPYVFPKNSFPVFGGVRHLSRECCLWICRQVHCLLAFLWPT